MIRAGSRSLRRRRPLLAGAFAEELLFRVYRDRRIGEHDTRNERRDRDCELALAEARNSSQPATIFGAMPCGRSRSSSSSRRPGDSAASRTRDSVARNAVANRVMLFLAPEIDAQFRARRWRRLPSAGLSPSSATASFVPSATCGRPRARPSHSCGSRNTSVGAEHRVFDVVATFLVPLLDGTRRRRERACVVSSGSDQHGVCRADSRTASRSTRRIAAGSTRCLPGRDRRRHRDTAACA